MPGRAVVAAVAALLVLVGCGDDDPTAQLTVGWGGTEGRPSCAYDAEASSVECHLTIDGTVPPGEDAEVTATVTAYADENTSAQVGSGDGSVTVAGDVHESLVVTIPVDRPPHIDEDGEVACRLSVEF